MGESIFAGFILSELTSPSFGLIFSGASGRQFVLNTNGIITGTDASDHISGQFAGVLKLDDDTPGSIIEIIADSIVVVGGLTVNQVLCKYHDSPQTQCDVSPLVHSDSQASASIFIGIDVTTNKIHSGGDMATVDFNINVTYQ